MGFNGDIFGAAHHTTSDQTKTELVSYIHADLVGRCAHGTIHNMLLRAQQFVSGDDRDAGVLRQSQVHNICHMPDEDYRPTHTLL